MNDVHFLLEASDDEEPMLWAPIARGTKELILTSLESTLHADARSDHRYVYRIGRA